MSLAFRLAAAVAAALPALFVGGCASNDCATDADCPAGRQCRVGLCSLGATGDAGDLFADVTLDCAIPAPGELVLNELLADPPAGADVDGNGAASTSDDEYVELVNLAIKPVALSGVELVVGDKRVPLGARCINPFESLVVYGSQGLPSLTNSAGSVALVQSGTEVQRLAWGPEGGKDSALVLATELDAASALVLHSEKFATAYSPGTCGNGRAFPDCAATDPGTPPGPADCDPPGASDLVINELLADPPAGSDPDGSGASSSSGDEFVEVVNVATRPVAMNAVELWVNDRKVTLGEGCLAPMTARVLFGSAGLPGLTNTGAVLTLRLGGEVVQTVTYGSDGGRDSALVRATELDPAAAWVSHQTAFGAPYSPGTCGNGQAFPNCGAGPVTPGDDVADLSDTATDAGGGADTTTEPGPDCPSPSVGELAINEIMRDPGNIDFNGDGVPHTTQDEFVEIVNPSAFAVSLAGLELHDGATSGRRHVFAAVCLPPGAAIVVFGGGTPAPGPTGVQVVKASTGDLGLNNTSTETVAIKRADGTIIDVVAGNPSGIGKSWVRSPDCSLGPVVVHPPLGERFASPTTLTGGGFFNATTCRKP